MKATDFVNSKRNCGTVSTDTALKAIELARLEGKLEALERMKINPNPHKIYSEVCFDQKNFIEKNDIGRW